jgi:hypothetical protein
MIDDATNSGKQQTREKYSIYVLKTNVLNSGIEGLRMTASLACRAAYVTGTCLTIACSSSRINKRIEFKRNALLEDASSIQVK